MFSLSSKRICLAFECDWEGCVRAFCSISRVEFSLNKNTTKFFRSCHNEVRRSVELQCRGGNMSRGCEVGPLIGIFDVKLTSTRLISQGRQLSQYSPPTVILVVATATPEYINQSCRISAAAT